MSRESAIGLFDSGIGGLTVLQKIIEVLPKENMIYLGDTARAPYGGGGCQGGERGAEKGRAVAKKWQGRPQFFVTDAPDRFVKVGQRFLGDKVESAVRIER